MDNQSADKRGGVLNSPVRAMGLWLILTIGATAILIGIAESDLGYHLGVFQILFQIIGFFPFLVGIALTGNPHAPATWAWGIGAFIEFAIIFGAIIRAIYRPTA